MAENAAKAVELIDEVKHDRHAGLVDAQTREIVDQVRAGQIDFRVMRAALDTAGTSQPAATHVSNVRTSILA